MPSSEFRRKTLLIEPIFYLLQRSAYTETTTFQFLVMPCQQGVLGCTRTWEHTTRTPDPRWISKGIFHTIWHCAEQLNLGIWLQCWGQTSSQGGVFISFSVLLSFFFFYLSPQVFLILLPHPIMRSEGMTVLHLAACWVKPQFRSCNKANCFKIQNRWSDRGLQRKAGKQKFLRCA